MYALKLTQIGNSVGVILPKKVLARLKVEKGDVLHLIDSADGIRLTPHDPQFATQMREARAVMQSGETFCTNWPSDGRQRCLGLDRRTRDPGGS